MADRILPTGFYVYLHRKSTTGEVFYVGKGCQDRAWRITERSAWWSKTCKKHGLIVEIYQDGIQEWYAHELECELIALYGRFDLGYGTLVNMTDGGDGMANPSVATRKKLSAALILRNSNEDVRAKVSAWAKEYNSRPEVKARISERSREFNARPEVRAELSLRAKEFNSRPEVKAEVSRRSKERNARPEVKAAHIERMIRLHKNPDHKEKVRSIRKALNEEPDFREFSRNNMRAMRADPELRARNAKANREVNGKRVRCIETGAIYLTFEDAAKWLRVNGFPKAVYSSISLACSGRYKTAYGCRWEYVSPV